MIDYAIVTMHLLQPLVPMTEDKHLRWRSLQWYARPPSWVTQCRVPLLVEPSVRHNHHKPALRSHASLRTSVFVRSVLRCPTLFLSGASHVPRFEAVSQGEPMMRPASTRC